MAGRASQANRSGEKSGEADRIGIQRRIDIRQ
jgi:hypothetical protein